MTQTIRRLAPHEKTYVVSQHRSRAIAPEAPTTVRRAPEPHVVRRAPDAPTIVEHDVEPEVEARTTIHRVDASIRRAASAAIQSDVEPRTTIHRTVEAEQKTTVHRTTEAARRVANAPTTVEVSRAPSVRMRDLPIDAPTCALSLPSLVDSPSLPHEQLSRVTGGLSPSAMPDPALAGAGSYAAAGYPSPMPMPVPVPSAPSEPSSRRARGSHSSPMPTPPPAPTPAVPMRPSATPPPVPKQSPMPTQPAAIPAKPSPVAQAMPAPIARDSMSPPSSELARGSQPIPQPAQAVSPDVFALIRRIALQQNLADAAGVLHAGLANLVSARVVLVQISDGGAISSPIANELRDAAAVVQLGLVAETARRRQRYTSERVVMVPLPTATRAVLVVWRKPDAPALDTTVIVTATHVATRLGVLDHFLAAAAEKLVREEADKKSLFRPEALAASRETRKDGELVDLSPRLLRMAIPAVLVIAVALVAAAAIVQVPAYSRGTVVVKANGHNVIASSSGVIARVLVVPGQQVAAGDPLIELDTTTEQQAFAQIDTHYRDQLSTFLFDTTDETARNSLAGILAQRKSALDTLTAKTITAPVAGAVSDVLVSDLVNAGEHVATIVPEGSQPSVLAFMPGADRSRIAPGMKMQVALAGYSDMRLTLTITEVGTDIMGSSKARKLLGEKLADAVALPPSVVLVKAALPTDGFTSRGKSYSFFDGMDGLAEIEIDRKSFLSVVIPTGE